MRRNALALSLLLAAAIPGAACDMPVDQTKVGLPSPESTRLPVWPRFAGADRKAPAEGKAVSGPFWAGAAMSGSWYDAARNGEGLIVQFLPNGRALAVWFTYPAGDEAGAQAWMIAQDGQVQGNTIRFANVLRPQGARFGAAFDPAQVRYEAWGTLELAFADCGTATLRYAGPAAFGSGQRNLTRLSSIDQLGCDGARILTESGARALAGMRARSGAWFVPDRAGEGWLVEELGNELAVVYWFTFDAQGRQAWTIGLGARSGDAITVADNRITRGTRFGDAFDAAAVERVPWGTLRFAFDGCNSAQVSYQGALPGFDSGERRAARLTELASAVCLDGTPRVRANGAWEEAPRIPGTPQSEHATTMLDGKIYMLGGFGDVRGFKRYDPDSGSWTELASLPSGRDHPAAFAFEGGVYLSGGAPHDSNGNGSAGFRYDVASNTWEARPELTFNYGSHAAVLNGRAYVGNDDGSLLEYDPRARQTRLVLPMPGIPRDHSQVVAYLGEIWMIAGRGPETTRVSIYDPVTERWRAGPRLRAPRGGFAAAVVDDQIVIGGGELITSQLAIVPQVEVYTAGMDSWNFAPSLPVPVHGVTGAARDGRFYLVGGATRPATALGGTGRMYTLRLTE